MGNNINKQTNSSQDSNKNTTDNNIINNDTETTTAPSETGATPTTSTTPTANPCENISQNISETSTLLQNINNIREQLAKLNIDPSQRVYYENCVVPLLTILYELTASSSTLATAVNFLAVSPVVHPKTSQLKDTTHLVYHINDKCEDVYKALKKRIDTMLDMC